MGSRKPFRFSFSETTIKKKNRIALYVDHARTDAIKKERLFIPDSLICVRNGNRKKEKSVGCMLNPTLSLKQHDSHTDVGLVSKNIVMASRVASLPLIKSITLLPTRLSCSLLFIFSSEPITANPVMTVN